ncbi:hypothetical protein AAFF_G00334550 [Aldrovandia affinis]|uniref:Uncharacterized protein n=1 Tax=Aldrovandia affinis TaxID=143900 RepID=A0AAD7WPJ8_9TELE|nr:hypothetical protein AAFF_G00334550 [Aldrovandia affinis]
MGTPSFQSPPLMSNRDTCSAQETGCQLMEGGSGAAVVWELRQEASGSTGHVTQRPALTWSPYHREALRRLGRVSMNAALAPLTDPVRPWKVLIQKKQSFTLECGTRGWGLKEQWNSALNVTGDIRWLWV